VKRHSPLHHNIVDGIMARVYATGIHDHVIMMRQKSRETLKFHEEKYVNPF
jgi:hypothetical protein